MLCAFSVAGRMNNIELVCGSTIFQFSEAPMSVSGFSTDSSAESDESIACSDKDNLPPKGRKPHQPETQLAQFAASAMDAVSDAGSLDEDALLSGPDCSDNEAHAKSRCSRSSLDAHQPHCKLKSRDLQGNAQLNNGFVISTSLALTTKVCRTRKGKYP